MPGGARDANELLGRPRSRLDRVATAAAGSRFLRTLRGLWRMGLPPVLRALAQSRDVCATTFWGGAMDVLLPERVSTCIWRDGVFEPDVCAYLLRRLWPGMTFVDVGAHFGFSPLGSHLTGPHGRVL